MTQPLRPGLGAGAIVGRAPKNTNKLNYKETLLEDLKKALELERGKGAIGRDSWKVFAEVVDVWEEEARSGLGEDTEIKDTLKQMNEKLIAIDKRTAGQPTKADTYAGVARAAAQALKVTGNIALEKKAATRNMEEGRKNKEIIIRMGDAAEAGGLRALSDKELLNRIHRAENEHAKEVAAVRWLPSGDALISVSNKEAKEKLEEEEKWTNCFGTSAHLLRRTYAVYVHGVKVNQINTDLQKESIGKIIKENEKWHKGLKIEKVTWPTKVLQNKKNFSSLLIETTSPHTANQIINDGLIINYEVKHCEMFDKNCKITQCYNCYRYGHIATRCRHPTRCGHCAKGHRSGTCPEKENLNVRQCAACGNKGHPAWSQSCRIRIEEQDRTRTARDIRPALFPTPSSTNTRSQRMASPRPDSRSRTPTNKRPTNAREEHTSDEDEMEVTETQATQSKNLTEWVKIGRRDRPVAVPNRKRLMKKIITSQANVHDSEECL